MMEQYSEVVTETIIPQNETLVWDAHELTEASHHVYGLTATDNGIILAFTEARLKPGDEAPHHLVLKRGNFSNGNMLWNDTQIIENGDDGHSWSNPAALYDRLNKTVFIFYVLNEGSREQISTKVYYRLSKDDGVTWSLRVDISDKFDNNELGWTFHMPGPGHGIQLRNQNDQNRNGRLIMPFWHRKAITDKPRCYGNSLLYSDDFGKTWNMGATTGFRLNMNECRIEEVASGKIVLNSRGGPGAPLNTSKFRFRTFSTDAGMSFGETEMCPSFEYCNCDAGMLQINGDTLLMSSLAHKSERAQLSLYKSSDNGLHWGLIGVIHTGQAQYSDLVEIDDKHIGILYGKGVLANQPVMFSVIDKSTIDL